MVRKLKFNEQKLLKKTDFITWEVRDLEDEVYFGRIGGRGEDDTKSGRNTHGKVHLEMKRRRYSKRYELLFSESWNQYYSR